MVSSDEILELISCLILYCNTRLWSKKKDISLQKITISMVLGRFRRRKLINLSIPK